MDKKMRLMLEIALLHFQDAKVFHTLCPVYYGPIVALKVFDGQTTFTFKDNIITKLYEQETQQMVSGLNQLFAYYFEVIKTGNESAKRSLLANN